METEADIQDQGGTASPVRMGRGTLMLLTILTEGGMLLAGLLGIWLTGVKPEVGATVGAVVAGIAAGTLLALGAAALVRSGHHLLQRLRRDFDLVVELFSNLSVVELAIISLLAGVGEEVLFRGFAQSWLTELWGVHIAVVVVAIVFGVLHAISRSYAVYAALLGMVLGYLYYFTGSLVAVMLAHATYDFVALIYGTRTHRGSQDGLSGK